MSFYFVLPPYAALKVHHNNYYQYHLDLVCVYHKKYHSLLSMNSTSSSSLHTLEVVSSALLEELDQERRKQEEAEGQNSPPLLLLLPSQLDFFSSLTSFYSSLQAVKNKEETSKPNEVEQGGGEEERDNQEGAFTVQQYCTCLMPAFKCLRLACAGNFDNAVLLTKIGAPQIVGESISACFCAYQEEREASSRDISSDDKSLNRDENSHKSDSSSHENKGDISSESLFKSLFIVAMQFFANYSSCKSLDNSVLVSFPNTLWSENGIGGVEGFSKYINMAVVLKARNGLTAIFAALYNCFLAEVDGTLTSFTSSRQLCCQLALSVMDMQYAECASSKSMDIRTSLPIHPNVEWFQILVLYLVKKDCFVAVLQQVKRNQVGQLDAKACFSLAMSHEEIIYISALQSILEDRVSVQHVPTECMQHIVWYLSQLILDNSDGLAGGIYPSAKTFDEESVAMDVKFAEFLSALQPKEEKFTGDKLRAVDHRVLSMPSTTCCMSIFSDLAAICNSTDAPFKEDLLKSGVMNICNAFLAGILEIKKGEKEKKSVAECKTDEMAYRSEIVNICLKILMNMTYHYKEAQDYCRVIGGFAAVLSFCATDFDSPLSREWALLCVRNLCEDNEENQNFVSSLQLKGVLQDEFLKSKGISVDVDPTCGKFSFKHKSNDASAK